MHPSPGRPAARLAADGRLPAPWYLPGARLRQPA